MASRRSHAALDSKPIEYELRVPRSGTYIMKPTAALLRSLQWVSDTYVSPRDTTLIGGTKLCVTNGNLYVVFAVKMSDFRGFSDSMLRFIDEYQ